MAVLTSFSKFVEGLPTQRTCQRDLYALSLVQLFCPFCKVTANVLDIIIVRKLSPFKLLCLPPHLIDCHL